MEAAKERLEYLRGEIEAERISYEEITELQSLVEHIDPSDVVLLEWAGVPECAAGEVVCPHCKGEKTLTINVQGGGQDGNLTINCVTCQGAGKVDEAEAISFKEMMDMWCRCGNASGHTTYVPDNQSSVCQKHHWICDDCGKVAQVG